MDTKSEQRGYTIYCYCQGYRKPLTCELDRFPRFIQRIPRHPHWSLRPPLGLVIDPHVMLYGCRGRIVVIVVTCYIFYISLHSFKELQFAYELHFVMSTYVDLQYTIAFSTSYWLLATEDNRGRCATFQWPSKLRH